MADQYIDPYILDYGVLPPDQEDYDSSEAYLAAYDEWLSGLEAYLNRRRAEEARQAAEEEAAQRAREEEEARQQTAAEEAAEEEHVIVPEEAARLPEVPEQLIIGSYIDAAGNVWSPSGELLSGAEDGLSDSYVDQAGHLWMMQYSGSADAQPLADGEIVTGDPTLDTALLLLDLIEELTGDEGMTSDVDGIQTVLDHPAMTTSFQEYTVTEGLLLLLLLSVFMAACAKMLKEGFAWLR